MWDYFKVDEALGRTVCQVNVNDKLCEASFKGKFSTNLKVHLKTKHPQQYQELIQKEKDIIKTKEASSKRSQCTYKGQQQTLAQVLQKGKKYERDHPHYKQITRKLAIFVASTSTPNSIVENAEFCSLLEEADSQYIVPSRYLLSNEIDEVVGGLRDNMMLFMSMARRINITTDLWSKKGMTASFLGITAHFYADHKRHNITIAVKEMPSPHTADNILSVVNDVLTDWNIPLHKVGNTITDNGSNIMKAFKEMKEEAADEVEDNKQSLIHSKEFENEADTEDDDENDMEGDGAGANIIDNELEDFEANEEEHQTTFSGYNRISCFAHLLQLVVVQFDKVKPFQKVLQKAKKLVAKFNKSGKATEKLIALKHKKLVSDSPTRWSSTFLLLERLLEIKDGVCQVVEELEWNNLQTSEWKKIENIVELLQPFAEYTTLCCGESYTTLSAVVPVILELNCHLHEIQKKPGMCPIAKVLQKEMHRRFDRYIDPSTDSFDGLHIAATLLDPEYTYVLSDMLVEEAKYYLTEILNSFVDNHLKRPATIQSTSETNKSKTEETVEPPLKKFRHLPKQLMQKKLKKEPLAKSSAEKKVELFMQQRETNCPQSTDALDFWVKSETQFPTLSLVACDLLVIPASSAPIERTFSIAGDACIGKRNRLTKGNLEREVLIKKNKAYLKI